MVEILIYAFLFSISPLGEARVGIPYAILNDVPFLPAFALCLFANLLIYPLMVWLVNRFDEKLWKYHSYRKTVLRLSRTAKKGVGPSVQKYGFWGLMVFVMIPLPGTGAYMGTIAALLFKIEQRQAFHAISLGVIISSIIMAVGAQLTYMGISGF